MNINYEYYRIFYYVGKYSNFTKAAHVLGSSQPNVTRAINCLENEVQCKLFVRTNRGVHLTPEGEKLYTRVSAAISILQMAEDELMESLSLEQGSISIGASETALNIYMLEKLRRFHIEYPRIKIKIHNHTTPQAVQSVRSGETEFAVVTTPVIADGSLKVKRLESFREVLIGGKTFDGLGHRKISLKEICRYPFICLGKETMTYKFYYDLFMSHGVELRPDTEVATTDQILPLVEHEMGLAFIPGAMAQEAVAKHKVTLIPTEVEIPERDICMVYDSGRPMSVAAHKLQEYIKYK